MNKACRNEEIVGNYIPSKEELEKVKMKKGLIQLSGDGVFHTIQGEGPYIGIPSTFIRLNQCNYFCKFCDTPYTFRRDMKEFYEARNYTALEVVDLIEKARKDKKAEGVHENLVITGGEPLLQMSGIEELIDLVSGDIQIETNGSIYPSEKILQSCDIICSPKLKSSGNKVSLYQNKVLRKLANKCSFKFVCSTEEDIEEVMEFIDEYFVDIGSVYIMPEGVTMEDNHKAFQRIINKVLEYGLIVTPRLQNIIWDGAERGV